MGWVIFIGIGLFVYIIYKASKKTGVEDQILNLETLAEQYYPEAIKEREEDLKDTSFDNFTKDEKLGRAKIVEQQIKDIKNFKEDYVRLRERYAHEPAQVRLELAQDYFNYYDSFHRRKSTVEHLKFTLDNDEADRLFEKMRELEVKAEEIKRRFEKKLKD